METKNTNFWYIILFPILIIILLILSAIKMGSTGFKQFDNVQTQPLPIPATHEIPN